MFRRKVSGGGGVFCASGRGSRNRILAGGRGFRSGYEGRERSEGILRGIFFGGDGRARPSVASNRLEAEVEFFLHIA